MAGNWRDNFNDIAAVSDKDWRIMADRLEPVTYKRKEIILPYSAVEKYIYFLDQGIVRFSYIKDKKDVAYNFFFDDDAFSAYDSFLLQVPSACQIQAVTPLNLFRISYEDMHTVYRESGVGNTIGRKIAEGLYIAKARRELSLLTEDAETRYLRFLANRPQAIDKLSLKDIASYIGITPQALSRIRRNLEARDRNTVR